MKLISTYKVHTLVSCCRTYWVKAIQSLSFFCPFTDVKKKYAHVTVALGNFLVGKHKHSERNAGIAICLVGT